MLYSLFVICVVCCIIVQNNITIENYYFSRRALLLLEKYSNVNLSNLGVIYSTIKINFHHAHFLIRCSNVSLAKF